MTPPPKAGTLVQSEKVRDTAPNVAAADLNELVTGNNQFAIELYQKLRANDPDANQFYSPYSISLALAMTYAGARNQTQQEMAATLHFMDQTRLHPAFNALDLALASRGENALGMDGKPMRLNIVNALWGQDGFSFLQEYLDTLGVNYGAGLRLVDFVNQTEESRQTINEWVSYYTENKIPELIPQGAIDGSTRLVLTNAIYFNAAWKNTFEEDDTQDAEFTKLDGSKTTVKMMHQTEDFKYAEGSGYQAVELPYDGEELSMVIFLPTAGTFSAFEDSLTAGKISTIIGQLGTTEVQLSMPKFKADYGFEMGDTLSQMGMPVAFDSGADFSGMTGERNLVIGEVIHKAYVLVSEKGTEAAAATGVVMELTSAILDQPKVMTIDRPFMFIIRDIETNSILFVGRMVDPKFEE
jgi:serpin B